jgi:hypothetical protein
MSHCKLATGRVAFQDGGCRKNTAQNFSARHFYLAMRRILSHRCFERSFIAELRHTPLRRAAKDKPDKEDVPWSSRQAM